jgi:putative salt-induced outer membrane protein
MRLLRIVLLAAPLAPIAACAAAAPTGAQPTPRLSGKGQLGFVASQGDSQAKSANAALNLAFVSGPWKHSLSLAALYGESLGVVSTERWLAMWQSNRRISTHAYAFGSLRYEHDLFDGFEYQSSAAAGLGYTLIHSKSTTLSTQLGAGYTVSRPERLTDIALTNPTRTFTERTPLATQGYAIGTLGVNAEQTLTRTTTLSDKVLVDAGSLNTLVTNNLTLDVKVATRLALSIGYDIQDNTHPAPGITHLDSTETVNLVYAF